MRINIFFEDDITTISEKKYHYPTVLLMSLVKNENQQQVADISEDFIYEELSKTPAEFCYKIFKGDKKAIRDSYSKCRKEELTRLNVGYLRHICRELEIKGHSKHRNKQTLVDFLFVNL